MKIRISVFFCFARLKCEIVNHCEILKHCIKKIPSKPFKFEESWFQSELYYQLRKFYPLGNDVGVSTNTYKSDLSIPENLPFRNWILEGINLVNQERLFYKYPDLVIHNLTTRTDTTSQEVIIEIKKSPNTNQIKTDITKLIIYCKGRLQFRKGVLIIYKDARHLIEVPNINEILESFPEIEIWIARPNQLPIIYCSTNLIPLL